MIGIMGGAFDPVHFGHLRLALELHQYLRLESIRWIPTGQPAHREQAQASAEHRQAMVQLAIEPIPEWLIDRREMERDTPSYMVETLKSLRAEIGNDTPLVILLGMDALQGLDSWYQWPQLFELAHIAVGYRPGSEMQVSGEALAFEIRQRQTDNVADFHAHSSGCILFHRVTQLEISSSGIRNLLEQDQEPRFLLPDAVLEYIQHHSLYPSI